MVEFTSLDRPTRALGSLDPGNQVSSDNVNRLACRARNAREGVRNCGPDVRGVCGETAQRSLIGVAAPSNARMPQTASATPLQN